MQNLLLTLILAIIWTAVQGTFTLGNFLVGFVLGYVVLRIMSPLLGQAGYDARAWHQIRLVGFFFVELFMSSLRVAAEVLTPGFSMKAGIMAIPMDVETDLERTMFANLISLTPGTLSLDIAEEDNLLFIHNMYIDESVEVSRRQIKEQLETRIRLATGSKRARVTAAVSRH